jgi:hypothetical protein
MRGIAKMPNPELTPKETRAIKALQRVANIWPDTLWIFAEGGHLSVMRKTPDGKHAITEKTDGGMDPDYIVETVYIEADGGDW